MEQRHARFSDFQILGVVVLLSVLLLALFYSWQFLGGVINRGSEGNPGADGSGQSGSGRPGQAANTQASTTDTTGTPQAAPLGTEGDPDALDCLKRQLEQTTLPAGDSQQADEPSGQSGSGAPGQAANTNTHPSTTDTTGTPQAAPLGTEGDPDALDCLKRQLEQTTLPPDESQQTDPSR